MVGAVLVICVCHCSSFHFHASHPYTIIHTPSNKVTTTGRPSEHLLDDKDHPESEGHITGRRRSSVWSSSSNSTGKRRSSILNNLNVFKRGSEDEKEQK